MSSVPAQSEALAVVAAQLAGRGSAMNAKNATAVASTAGVVPAAADEVSALMALQFAVQAQIYQAVSAQAAAAIHELFVSALPASAGSDAATEADDAAITL